MKARIALLLIAAIVAGLFWSLGIYFHAIISHFIAPPFFAAGIAILFHTTGRRHQVLLLVAILSVAELTRLVMFSVIADGWRYISNDSETQTALLFSFTLQILIAFFVWSITWLLLQRLNRRST